MIACAFCGSTRPLTMCSACRTSLYCGRGCQRSHWPVHRARCAELVKCNASMQASSLSPSLTPLTPDQQSYRGALALGLAADPISARSVMLAQWGLARANTRDPATRPDAFFMLAAALATARELYGCVHSVPLMISKALASCLLIQSRWDEGLLLLQDTHSGFSSVLGEYSPKALECLLMLLQQSTFIGLQGRFAPQAQRLLEDVDEPIPPSAHGIVALAIERILQANGNK